MAVAHMMVAAHYYRSDSNIFFSELREAIRLKPEAPEAKWALARLCERARFNEDRLSLLTELANSPSSKQN